MSKIDTDQELSTGSVEDQGAGEPPAETRKPLTARALLESGLVGIWNDRTDIGSSQEFARTLRRQAETRQRGEARAPDGL